MCDRQYNFYLTITTRNRSYLSPNVTFYLHISVISQTVLPNPLRMYPQMTKESTYPTRHFPFYQHIPAGTFVIVVFVITVVDDSIYGNRGWRIILRNIQRRKRTGVTRHYSITVLNKKQKRLAALLAESKNAKESMCIVVN